MQQCRIHFYPMRPSLDLPTIFRPGPISVQNSKVWTRLGPTFCLMTHIKWARTTFCELVGQQSSSAWWSFILYCNFCQQWRKANAIPEFYSAICSKLTQLGTARIVCLLEGEILCELTFFVLKWKDLYKKSIVKSRPSLWIHQIHPLPTFVFPSASSITYIPQKMRFALLLSPLHRVTHFRCLLLKHDANSACRLELWGLWGSSANVD